MGLIDVVAGTRRGLSRRAALGGMAVASLFTLAARTPAAIAKTANAERERDRMWIPFRIDRLGLIEIEVQVNGQHASAVLDTGATRTTLDRSFATRTGIESREGFRGNGLTDGLFGGLASGIAIDIGGRRLAVLESAVLDLSGISAALGYRVDIVLGQELFETRLVEIDFPSNRLRLLAPGTELESGTSLHLRAAPDRLRTLPAVLPGNIAVAAALDLGSNVPLYVDPALAQRHGLLKGLRTSTLASAGAEGIDVGTVAVLPSVTIAGVRLHNLPVQIPQRWRFASEVLVGIPILSRFRLGLDFSTSRAWIEPESALVSEPFPKDRLGLGVVPGNGHLRVIHVAPGSPAELSGLAAGDEITAVNGRTVDETFLMERPRIGHGPPETKVALELSNGDFRALVLQDYF